MNQIKRLTIISGGTGGHVFPGLSVAQYLIKQGWEVKWIGTNNHIEANLVPRYGIEIDFIHISSLRGKGIKTFLLSIISILHAYLQARLIIKQFKPDVVLGMGGYVSGPGGLAAWSLGIPVIIHEQNRIAGLTNKLLAKIANKVLQAFPDTFFNAKVVGNPIRTDILSLPNPKIRLQGRRGPLRVLVLGGSQGAKIFNQVIPQVAKKLENKVTILHQSGKVEFQTVRQAYSRLGQSQHKVIKFIENMASAYAWADIIISRSGALTVSEVTAACLPAIFVPFQHKDRQQYWNALPLEKAGAAKIFEEFQFTVDAVVNEINSYNREILMRMSQRTRSLLIPNSTEKLAQEIIMMT